VEFDKYIRFKEAELAIPSYLALTGIEEGRRFRSDGDSKPTMTRATKFSIWWGS
jgi:hypothetical protein